MTTVEQLLRAVEAYCTAKGIAEATLAGRVLRDGKGFRVLREGGDLTTRRAETVFRYLAEHWPDGVAWPDGVPRPQTSSPAAGASAGPPDPAPAHLAGGDGVASGPFIHHEG